MTVPAEGPVKVAGNTWVKTARQYWKDFRERAFSTFWQTFVGVVIATQPATDWNGVRSVLISALVAAIASVLSMVKSIIVRNRGVKNSASSSTKV